MLSPLGIEVITPGNMGIDFYVEETGNTFQENARLKSEALFSKSGIPCLADDSGICVDYLNGEPGVFSARYGKPELDDKGRALFLLENMKGVKSRTAYYQCCLSYTTSTQTYFIEEKCHGFISDFYDEDGKFGFGYDPIFISSDLNILFSRVSPEIKNNVSHRGKALKQFLEGFKMGVFK